MRMRLFNAAAVLAIALFFEPVTVATEVEVDSMEMSGSLKTGGELL